MRCTCAKCLSVFSNGSGPSTPKWNLNDEGYPVLYVCPGCKHGTTVQEWMVLDTVVDETRYYLRWIMVMTDPKLLAGLNLPDIETMGLPELNQTLALLLGPGSGFRKDIIRKTNANLIAKIGEY